MSDFLIRIGCDCRPEDLLAVLKRPYDSHAPQGRAFGFPWGSMAVLEDHHAHGENIVCSEGMVLAWVGELVGNASGAPGRALMSHIANLKSSCGKEVSSADDDGMLAQLNGAFCIVLATAQGMRIVTDPMSFTQVFVGRTPGGRVTTVGTHADIVAVLSDASPKIDLVSIAQFLRNGYCTFPNTMHANVTELCPGSVHFMELAEDGSLCLGSLSYWVPPQEMRGAYKEDDWVAKLRDALLASVRDRCVSGTVGVALSGGLDSRMVMASVPPEVECIGLTMCDTLNREAQVARRVAAQYKRTWLRLSRQKDYLAENFVGPIRLMGCECEAIHAHLFGFGDVIGARVDSLLTGDLLDTLLRAYCAKDYGYRHRLGGLFPRRYEMIPFDYLHSSRDFWDEHLTQDVLEDVAQRQKEFYDSNANSGRRSVAESLKLYPFRQWAEVATWAAHRRRLPMCLVGGDRRLLDFAFTCPVELKLGDRIFLKAAKQVFGPGLRIPSANNGVRPCSGHLSRLMQRAIRKSQDRFTSLLEQLGRKAPIQHSWHDYPAYWRESEKLAMLRRRYGPNLDCLDGVLFKGSGQALLNDRDLFWEHGFRLLQLAIWLGVVKEYRIACGQSLN